MGHSASIEYLRLFKDYAIKTDLNTDKIFQKAGIQQSTLENAGSRIMEDQFIALWDVLVEQQPDRNLGLHMGEHTFMYTGQILTTLMLHTPTIRDAIDNYCKYFSLINNFTTPCISVKGNQVEMSFQSNLPEVPLTRHVSEAILATYATMLNRISEHRIRFEGVYFNHSHPGDISEHSRIFKAPVFFNRKENKLVFCEAYLSLPVLLSNEEVFSTLEQLALKLREKLQLQNQWSDKAKRIISRLIKGGKPKVISVAKELGVSRRILQSRLKEEGVTYQGLLDDVRTKQAIYLLNDRTISLNEIAFRLGYSEQSAFGRGFKRWQGCTPAQYRAGFKH